MLYLQGCVRCNLGAMYLNSDQYGYYVGCLTCGYLRDVNEITINGKSQPDMDHVRSLIRTLPKVVSGEDQKIDPFIAILLDLSRRNQPAKAMDIQESTGLEQKVIEERLSLMKPIEYGLLGYVSIAHEVNGSNGSGEPPKKFTITDSGRYVIGEYKAQIDSIEKLADGGMPTQSIDNNLLDTWYTLTQFGKQAISKSEILFGFIDHIFENLDSKKSAKPKPRA